MLLSRLPVDSSLSDYHPTQVLGYDKQDNKNYDFYTVLPDQADGNLPVQEVTPAKRAAVVTPATRVVPGNVHDTRVLNLAAENYAEVPASSIGQESYYLQAGSFKARSVYRQAPGCVGHSWSPSAHWPIL